ncbi:MAG: endonuclease [Actinomycetota bacterium]|nr:endonuclease [Actinomycetota bacterium]
MPEGNTVHLAARRLNDALAGETISRSDFRVPKLATLDLSGRVVRSVLARGKHIFIRLDDETSVHTHFKMDGEWHLYRPAERWRGPSFQVRLVLATTSWIAVGFRLPVIDVVPTASEDTVVGHLGPDILGPDWDAGIALERLVADPDRPIGEALLDQRVMAGLGNVFRCELCYLTGVDPSTPIGLLRDPARVIALAHKLVVANRGNPDQVTTGDPRGGRSHWVYGRGGRSCRRCKSTIHRRDGADDPSGRVTYWCPTCQPVAMGARAISVARADGGRPGG